MGAAGTPCPPRGQRRVAHTRTVPVGQEDGRCDGPTPGPEVRARILRRVVARTRTARTRPERSTEIGRASCRERVYSKVVGGTRRKKKKVEERDEGGTSR